MKKFWLPVLLCACRAPGAAGEITAWRLVEIDVEGGRQLVVEPDEPPPPAPEGIEVSLSRTRAGVDEVVEAEVWLTGATGRRRIEARPSREGVEILGPREFLLEGGRRVTVRFTCRSGGRGGIVVVARE